MFRMPFGKRKPIKSPIVHLHSSIFCCCKITGRRLDTKVECRDQGNIASMAVPMTLETRIEMADHYSLGLMLSNWTAPSSRQRHAHTKTSSATGDKCMKGTHLAVITHLQIRPLGTCRKGLWRLGSEGEKHS